MQTATNAHNTHINGGGGDNLSLSPLTLSRRISLSIACAISLACLELQANTASAPMPPQNDPNDLVSQIGGGANKLQVFWKTTDKQGHELETLYSPGWNNDNRGWYGNTSHYIYESVALAYNSNFSTNTNFYFPSNGQIDFIEFNYKKVGDGNYVWQRMSTQGGSVGNRNRNLNITTFNTKGDVRFEIKLGGNSTIASLTNTANRLSLNAESGNSLAVTTLNQQGGSGEGGHSDLVIQESGGSIVVTTLNQTGGIVYQKGGEVTTANLSSGAYYQGYGPNAGQNQPTGSGGTIGTLNLSGGSFTQHNGQVTTLEQSGGTATQHAGTITTLNLSGGTFTHNGGTLSSVVLKAGGSGGTFVNGTDSAFGSITQEGGDHAIIGKIASFTLKDGSFTNHGQITKLTSGTSTTTRAFRAASSTKHITNTGTIDDLVLNEATAVTNTGTIKALDVKSGNSTINTLNGVGQATNAQPHHLSNINITANSAKLTVDTLSVGIKGNTGIQRVTINGDTGQGNQKEFAVNKIQVTYLDGDFDPAKSISNKLTDYVTQGSHSYVDGASKPTFESSPELEGIGVKFNPDGTPVFDLEASLAASMTSLVVRQSMRRKMLLDTYLAEQSRRSLKNKERRTKQRIEAATLGEARAQYQKDLAKYNKDKAAWDKLANTKENKALIAKYEQDEKAYQAAKDKYEKDKKAYDENRKNLELLSKANKIKAPIEPKAPAHPNVKPSDKHYKKAMADFAKAQKAYEKAMAKYEQDYGIYDQERKRLETLAQASNLKAPTAPKAPARPNIKPNHKDYKRVMAAYEQEQHSYQAALKQYALDKKAYDEKHKKLEVLAKTNKITLNAPIEPKAPVRPDIKPNHKDYKKAMAAYEQERKDYLKDFKQYELDKKSYEREYQKLLALAEAQSNKLKAPVEPKAPSKPKILASKPEMPQEPKLGEISAELLAKHQVQGDFFIRAFGGTGAHNTASGTQTNSWSVGTLFGANWHLPLGQTGGNIGFYGGYEYIHNGYKQAHINAQGHTGFLGLRFSHLFAKTKLAGFYYLADINGGYSDISIAQDMNRMRFEANVGNINFGSSIRLGSSVYMAGSKSMLFPSVGVGVEGGYLGEFEMRTQRSGELRYGGLSQGYAVTYAQANLNYYQEYGRKISTTLGGGFRYLFNTDISVMPTLNGKPYTINEATGRAAVVHIAPFFYQGTAMINYHTQKAGNFSAGYVAVGGLLGITHNASMRWHYFF